MKHLYIRYLTLTIYVLSLFFSLPVLAIVENGYTLSVVAKPSIAGSFNTNNAILQKDETIHLYAYSNSNFTFKEWQDAEGNTIALTQDFVYTMPGKNVTLTAQYEYNPANPENPAKNSWDATSGVAIVDDFPAGSLAGAISTAIKGSKNTELLSLIVAGRITNNDYNVINTYTNCTILDLSRVSGTAEVPSYAFDYTKLESVYLPSTIEKIGSRAFYDCKQLTSLTLYAMVPPTLGSNVFAGVQDGLVVYVPAAAISQYQGAEGWKNFVILPIQEDIRSISISLPEGANASDYAQMWLELTNTKSGQRMHYVMTDRQKYTFANIIRNTTWSVKLRNERGDIFGQIDNVEVKDEDISVVFSSLSKPQNVSLVVQTPNGQDVTAQTQITWTDAQGNYVTQGASLSGLPVGYQANYSVVLSQELTMQYVTPHAVEYVLKNGGNNITCQLQPIKQIQISGKVKDAATGLPLSGATISASQTFGGKYSKTLNAKTDNGGVFTLTIANVPTSVVFAAADYVSQTVDLTNHELDEFAIPDVSLKSITGATISIGFTYTTVDGETQNWYSDYQNVGYELFNVTKNRAISQYNVQYPQIVLMEEIEDGDMLRLTATSRTGAFLPVEATATINEQKAEATFGIVELGQIRAAFTTTGNASVVGSLYDGAGKLLKTYDYANASLTISDLADGRYTLVSMGSSRLFNTIYDLSQMPQTGLAEGSDYVQHSVEVKSGAVSLISISEVPTLDESKLYYTGEGTSFTVNKPSIVAGNYLTLTGRLDFKPAYAASVSNVQMIVDLPESCEFVENSVMVGNSASSYTLNGNRISIPMTRYTDRVRFCIIPTLGGDYAPSAFAQFDLDGETVTQPIGSANYTAKDLSISVPSTVAKTSIPVSGTAIGTSNVEIYDNDVLIGQTTSLANGTWATTCELDEPYNLSTHSLYAKVTTKTGLELISKTSQVVYDINMIVPEKVTMLYYNPEYVGQYNIVFDLINNTVSPKSYYFFPYKSYPNWRGSGTEPKDFTFVADLSNNDSTAVNGVTIRVYTDNGYWRNLEAQYNSSMNRWVAVSQFTEEEAPVGIDVIIDAKSETIADRDKIDEDLSASNSLFSEVKQSMDRVNHLLSVNQDEETSESFTVLQNYLESDNYDASEVNKWIQSVMYNQTSGDVMTDEMADSLTILYQKDLDDFTEKLKNSPDSSVFALLYLPTELNLLAPTSEDVSFEHEGYIYKQKKWTPVSVENLLNDGFLHYNLTDSTQVFFKYEDSGLIIIDTKKAVEFSMLPLDKANSQSNMPRRASDASGFALCVKDWNLLVANILKYKDINTNLDLKNVLTIATQVRGTVQGIIDASSCFYRDYYITFKYNLDNSYKKFVKEIEDKIEARRNLIDKHWERIKVQNDMISQQEDMIRQYQKNIDELFAQAYNTSDPNVLNELEKQIKHNEDLIKASQEHIKLNKQIISDINIKDINQIEKQINLLSNEREAIEEGYKLAKKTVKRIPTLSKGKKAVSVWTKLGRLAGPLGILCGVADIFATGWEACDEINEWIDLGEAMLRKLPCEGNPDEAELLCIDIAINFIGAVKDYASILRAKAGAIALNTVDVPVFTPHWWVASGLDIYAEWANLWVSNKNLSLRRDFWRRMLLLKCIKDDYKCPRCGKNPCECKDKCPICGNKPCTCPEKCPRCGKKPCECPPPPNNTDVQHDPSGYVYEGVASNRLQGVIASCYYKETVEDMYGDLHENVVLWDAEEYAQKNPLFTDEYGMYRWDVPKGLWQVKFEKEGYETTYSEWLPVPPPQLDVNIAMKQNRQPEVKSARAYEDAVEVEFDKYMMPELLTTENIMVMQNGTAVEGAVELLNEEVSYEGETETFASKIRFNAAQPFTEQEITLLVNNRVKSYAGLRMQDDYQQTFTIEQEIKQILSDSVVTVGYGNASTLTVSVLPASASKGKMLTVKTSSPMILDVETEQVTIGNDGKAEITVSGELPGTAALTFTIDGYNLSAMTIVNVEQIEYTEISAPTASIASGTTVEKGTKITLTCATEGATIYYTLDGSCPCDEASRLTYTEPIIVNETVTIKAMAVASDMTESDIVEFTYIVDEGVGIDDVTIDEHLKIYPIPVRDKLNITAGGKIIKSVSLVSMSGSTVVSASKPVTHVTVDVSSLTSGIYIINVATEDKTYSRKIMKVE